MRYTSWKMPNNDPGSSACLSLGNYPALLSLLLSAKGVSDAAQARLFINGNQNLLSDPFLLTDMDKAVLRLRSAIETGEKIAVYGDYDVDGITAACLISDYLRSKGLESELYIPDRIEEGYGLNLTAIESLSALGVSLIITVDCGVTAVREAEYAAGMGIDMIITDHHECATSLPEAVAVVNPKRQDSPLGSPVLAGVGVAFKLVCALDGDCSKIFDKYCDLVAIGTIADVIPLTLENRFIVKSGIIKLREHPSPGLCALIQESGIIKSRLNSMNISYTIAPRLNAAGRLGMAQIATELLLTEHAQQATMLAQSLCGLNRDRQELETKIWESSLEALGGQCPNEPIVLAGNGWHQGVIGIVASRLADTFGVPSVMISLDGSIGKGSCRSCGNWSLYNALSACGELLESFGGHALAAGMTIKRENIDAFRSSLGQYYRENPPDTVREIEIDLVIDSLDLLSMECVQSLELLEPFGSGNPRPLLCITDALLDSVTPLSGGKHLKLFITKFSRSFECVFFSQTEHELGVQPGTRVDIVFFPQINEFRSKRTVQLSVADIRRSEIYTSCLKILEGEKAGAAYTGHIPDRSDFARLWRIIERYGGVIRGSLPNVLEILGTAGEHPFKLTLSLAVLSELGLLSIIPGGEETLIVEAARPAEKVCLDNSLILRGLRKGE